MARGTERGSIIIEGMVSVLIILFMTLLVIQFAVLAATKLMATYAAFMAARAAGVQRPDDREDVAFQQANRLLFRAAVGSPELADDTLTLCHAQSRLTRRGNATSWLTGIDQVPFLPFPRREGEADTEGDNPLP